MNYNKKNIAVTNQGDQVKSQLDKVDNLKEYLKLSQDQHKIEQKLSMKSTKGKQDMGQAINFATKVDTKLTETVIKQVDEIKNQLITESSRNKRKGSSSKQYKLCTPDKSKKTVGRLELVNEETKQSFQTTFGQLNADSRGILLDRKESNMSSTNKKRIHNKTTISKKASKASKVSNPVAVKKVKRQCFQSDKENGFSTQESRKKSEDKMRIKDLLYEKNFSNTLSRKSSKDKNNTKMIEFNQPFKERKNSREIGSTYCDFAPHRKIRDTPLENKILRKLKTISIPRGSIPSKRSNNSKECSKKNSSIGSKSPYIKNLHSKRSCSKISVNSKESKFTNSGMLLSKNIEIRRTLKDFAPQKPKPILSNKNSISVSSKSKHLARTEIFSKASKKTKNTFPKARHESKVPKTRSKSNKQSKSRKTVSISKRRTLETLEDEINRTYGKQNLALPLDPIQTNTGALGSPYFQTPANLKSINSHFNQLQNNFQEKKDISNSTSYRRAQCNIPNSITSRIQDKTYDMVGISNSTIRDQSRTRVNNIIKSQMNSMKVSEKKFKNYAQNKTENDAYKNKSAQLEHYAKDNTLIEYSCPLDINTFVQADSVSGTNFLPNDTHMNINPEFVKSMQNSCNTSMAKAIKRSSKKSCHESLSKCRKCNRSSKEVQTGFSQDIMESVKECRKCYKSTKDVQTGFTPEKINNKSQIINNFKTDVDLTKSSDQDSIVIKLHSPASELRIEKKSESRYVLKDSKSEKQTILQDQSAGKSVALEKISEKSSQILSERSEEINYNMLRTRSHINKKKSITKEVRNIEGEIKDISLKIKETIGQYNDKVIRKKNDLNYKINKTIKETQGKIRQALY